MTDDQLKKTISDAAEKITRDVTVAIEVMQDNITSRLDAIEEKLKNR